MKNILEQIYWGEYAHDNLPLSEREQAGRALERVWADAADRLGFPAADGLRDAYQALLRQDSADDFRAGFRLGAALILELVDRG